MCTDNLVKLLTTAKSIDRNNIMVKMDVEYLRTGTTATVP